MRCNLALWVTSLLAVASALPNSGSVAPSDGGDSLLPRQPPNRRPGLLIYQATSKLFYKMTVLGVARMGPIQTHFANDMSAASEAVTRNLQYAANRQGGVVARVMDHARLPGLFDQLTNTMGVLIDASSAVPAEVSAADWAVFQAWVINYFTLGLFVPFQNLVVNDPSVVINQPLKARDLNTRPKRDVDYCTTGDWDLRSTFVAEIPHEPVSANPACNFN